jgi:hypothetical protein
MIGNAPFIFQGPQVWRGADFERPTQCCFALTQAALAEIGLLLSDQACPTPGLNRDLSQVRTELAAGRGFVIIRGPAHRALHRSSGPDALH